MATIFVSNAGSNTSPFDTEAKAATTLGAAITAATNVDTIKVSSTHAESTVGAITYTLPTSPGLKIVSVLFNGSGTGAATAGGAITNATNGTAFGIASGFAYVYGLSFSSAAGTSNSNNLNIVTANAASGIVFESCTFLIPGTGTSSRLNIGASTSNLDTVLNFINCTINSGIDRPTVLRHGKIIFDNLTLAGTAPTTVFAPASVDAGEFIIRASDLSNLAWTNLVSVTLNTVNGYFKAIGCKLRASFTLVTGTFSGPGAFYVEAIDCNSGDVNYYYKKESWEGSVEAINSIYYNAGDGLNDFSFKMISSANASFIHPLESPPISYFNKSLSALQTTIHVTNDGTTFTDAELWQETLAKITSGVPLATWNRDDRAANILATPANQATSTVSWTGTGGFASEVKQQLVSGSFTPAEIGNITTVVKLAKASSTIYISPKIITSPKQFMTFCGTLLNESSISTNPGITNVISPTGYTINDTSYTGSYVGPTTTEVKINTTFGVNLTGTYYAAERYSDPGVAFVVSGTSYLFNAVTLTGTFSGGGATYSDPGTTNVRLNTTYIYNNVTQTGSLNVPTPASGTAGTVDIGNIKETIRYVIGEANTTTGSPIDLSANLSSRVKYVMKVNPEKIRVDGNQLPCVTVFASKKTVKPQTIAKDLAIGKRRADLTMTVVGMVWNDSTTDYREDSADEDVEILMENIEYVLRYYASLNSTVAWQFPTDVTYHTVAYDEQTHMRVGVLDLQVTVFY